MYILGPHTEEVNPNTGFNGQPMKQWLEQMPWLREAYLDNMPICAKNCERSVNLFYVTQNNLTPRTLFIKVLLTPMERMAAVWFRCTQMRIRSRIR